MLSNNEQFIPELKSVLAKKFSSIEQKASVLLSFMIKLTQSEYLDRPGHPKENQFYFSKVKV